MHARASAYKAPDQSFQNLSARNRFLTTVRFCFNGHFRKSKRRARKALTAVTEEKDSTQNIARRYTYLFRLPTKWQAVSYASLPIIGVVLIARSFTHESLLWVAAFAVITELVLIAGINIDLLMLRGKSGLATFRRLATVSIISNGLWLLSSLVGLLLYAITGSEAKLLSLVILGAFFAISFRAIVFGSVFYGVPILGLAPALVQPLLLLVPAALAMNLAFVNSETWVAVAGGIVAIAGIEIYLVLINKPVKGFKALRLLQAFLKAWTVGNPSDLEHYFSASSEETKVSTEMISLRGSGPSALLIVPGVHPGPFSPVGSSNLPGDIYEKLRTETEIPLIFHSISDHELNLPSKEEVRKYADSLGDRREVEEGKTMSSPVVVKEGKGTASGYALGKTVVIALTLSPNGMEDLPGVIRDRIEEKSKRAGFEMCLVVDSHNSLGEKPDERETENLILAASRLISELSNEEQSDFKFGFAHSSEIQIDSARVDIGPAGVGLLLFEARDSRFCHVVVDANNSTVGFREKVVGIFQNATSERLLEICTSDTHVTAAKADNAKGYFALGDLTTPEQFTTMLATLLEKAKTRMSAGSYETFLDTCQVRTIGSQILDSFSGLLDETAFIARRGAQVLGLLGVIITIVVAVL